MSEVEIKNEPTNESINSLLKYQASKQVFIFFAFVFFLNLFFVGSSFSSKFISSEIFYETISYTYSCFVGSFFMYLYFLITCNVLKDNKIFKIILAFVIFALFCVSLIPFISPLK